MEQRTITTEKWRQVAAPFSAYQVSNLGRLIGPRGVMKMTVASNGFRVACLRVDGLPPTYRTTMVGRLVAMAFCRRRGPNDIYVRRRNAKTTDDRAANLYWGPKYSDRLGVRVLWTKDREPWISEEVRDLLEVKKLGLVRTATLLGVPVQTLWKKAKKNGWRLAPRGRPRRGMI